MNIFGKKKQAPAPNIAASIQQLREAQAMLEKRETHLDKQAKQLRSDARTRLQAKDKRGALYLLKKAKIYDAQIGQIYGKRSNLDVQIMALEGAASNNAIFASMREGQAALKVATAQTKVDNVSDMMENINESIQDQEEINEALSQQIGPAVDDDELQAELEEMEQQMHDKELLEVSDLPISTASSVAAARTVAPIAASPATTTSAAPAVAARKPINEKESKELKELELMMGM